MSAEKLAAVVLAPVVERIEDVRSRAEHLGMEAEVGLVEQVREGLTEAWRLVERRGT